MLSLNNHTDVNSNNYISKTVIIVSQWLYYLCVSLIVLLSIGCQEMLIQDLTKLREVTAIIPAANVETTQPFETMKPIEITDGRRVALVIGNNAYQYTATLNNAVADAQALHSELTARGFSVVYREDATRRDMNDAIDEFLGKLSTDAIGVIYYSGHGIQISGANFLLPTDIQVNGDTDIINDGIELGRLLDRTSQMQTKFTLAIIDACRNNPFKNENKGRAIGVSKGLAPPLGNASGIMIIYSAGAGQEALDGDDNGTNGLFTSEFIKAIRLPGLRVQEVVDRVKMAVIEQAKSRNHVQTPAIYDQSVGTFYFIAQQTSLEDNSHKQHPVSEEKTSIAKLEMERKMEEARLAEIEKANSEAKEKLKTKEEQLAVIEKTHLEAEKKLQAKMAQLAKVEQQRLKAKKPITVVATTPQSSSSAMSDSIGQSTEINISNRYQDHDDGTVTDIQTSLMWKRCSEGQTWNGVTCTGRPSDMSQSDIMGRQNWSQFAGYDDWRLPTKEELNTLVYCSNGIPKTWNDTGNPCLGAYQKPTIDLAMFPNTLDRWFWTASPSTAYDGYTWIVDFHSGSNRGNGPKGTGYVRLVR